MALSLLLKATLVMLIGLAAAQAGGRTRASVRHLMLAATFAALLVLPVAEAYAPFARVPVTVLNTTVVSPPRDAGDASGETSQIWLPAASGIEAVSPRGAAVSLAAGALTAWALGAVLLLSTFAIALWRVRGIRNAGVAWEAGQERVDRLAREFGVRRRIVVLLHGGVAAPFTCGWMRPAIVLPEGATRWDDRSLYQAFVHEIEHVHRADWATHLAARALCAAYWFHPLVWVVWRRLCVESERACDDAVVTRGDRADYAAQLVTLARQMSSARLQPMLSMAGRGDLALRVKAVLDATQLRGRPGLAAASLVLGTATVLVLGVAPLRAVAAAGSAWPDAGAAQGRRANAFTSASVELLEQSERGNRDEVSSLLRQGADVNVVIPGDGTPLIVAAREGHLDLVQMLLDGGADPNLAVLGDGNPLIMAAQAGHLTIVRLLLDRGADINAMVPEDENALINASSQGHLAVVQLLVERGANVNAGAWAGRALERPGDEWRTPLRMARAHGHRRVVEYLIAHGAVE